MFTRKNTYVMGVPTRILRVPGTYGYACFCYLSAFPFDNSKYDCVFLAELFSVRYFFSFQETSTHFYRSKKLAVEKDFNMRVVYPYCTVNISRWYCIFTCFSGVKFIDDIIG